MYRIQSNYLLKLVEEFILKITPYSTLSTVIPMSSYIFPVTENSVAFKKNIGYHSDLHIRKTYTRFVQKVSGLEL